MALSQAADGRVTAGPAEPHARQAQVPTIDPEGPTWMRARRPGPKRAEGAPTGPDQVRGAILDAAARLFGERGVADVSLRDIAEAADVHFTLIRRYVGRRAELIDAVFRKLDAQLATQLRAHPLGQLPYGPGSDLSKWLAMSSYYNTRGEVPPLGDPNPIGTLADAFEEAFGHDRDAARVRALQVAAVTLGWRLFERQLTLSAGFSEARIADLRDEMTALQLVIASTDWPTPHP